MNVASFDHGNVIEIIAYERDRFIWKVQCGSGDLRVVLPAGRQIAIVIHICYKLLLGLAEKFEEKVLAIDMASYTKAIFRRPEMT